jgi:hypothetical protein
MKSLAFSVFLLPALLLPVQPQQPPAPVPPPAQTAPSSCPIRADEAYLTGTSEAMPQADTGRKRILHVTLVNAAGKAIVAYSVHARIAVNPSAPTPAYPVPPKVVTRSWKGDLQPDLATRERWTFPADDLSMNLQRVWFDEVIFADGTTWAKTAKDGCTYPATPHIVQTNTRTPAPAK